MWLMFSLNEKLYTMVYLPVWLAAAGLAVLFLCIAVFRTLEACGSYRM